MPSQVNSPFEVKYFLKLLNPKHLHLFLLYQCLEFFRPVALIIARILQQIIEDY